MTVLVLAHPGDRLARDAATALRRAQGGPVVATTPDRLTRDVTYRHEEGTVRWVARLPDRELVSTGLVGVLNRSRYVGRTGFADRGDELYAGMERSALLAAMLASLPVPVLNRPNGAGLAGPTSSAVTLLAQAARAELPVAPLVLSTEALVATPAGDADPAPGDAIGTLTVVGDAVVGDGCRIPDSWVSAALTLAARTGCDLLSLPLVDVGGMPCVAAVDPWPRSLGPRALRHLVALLASAPDPSARSARLSLAAAQ